MKRSLDIIGQSVRREYERADWEINRSLSQTNVSCTKGCANCCRMLLMLSLDEALAIAATYPMKLKQRRKKIVNQAARFKTVYRQVFGDVEPDHAITNDEEMAEFSRKNNAVSNLWWRENQSCVFLRPDDNTCSIYSVRPVACRTYYVQSDPALCGGPPGTDVEVVAFGAAGQELRLRLLENSVSPVVTFQYAPLILLEVLLLLEKNKL